MSPFKLYKGEQSQEIADHFTNFTQALNSMYVVLAESHAQEEISLMWII